MQEQLERYPSAELQVYAIWLPMLATDARSEWHAGLLRDRRVNHFWDEDRIAGLWFAQANTADLGYAGIVWDAYFLFERDASWEDVPGPVVSAGAPVVNHDDALEAGFERLVGS